MDAEKGHEDSELEIYFYIVGEGGMFISVRKFKKVKKH